MTLQNSPLQHASLVEFEASTASLEGLHQISLGRAPLAILSQIKVGRPMVVFFSAAVPAKVDKVLPWFTGTGVMEDLAVSKVSVCDPTLYLSPRLRLAWYAGAKGLDVQKSVTRALTKLIAIAKPSKVLMVGGSGGGFAAMYYSSQVPGSLATAWNPQTNIFAYSEIAVLRYLEAAWNIKTVAQGEEALRGVVTTDLFSLYEPGTQTNFALYLQNESDAHVTEHLEPLLGRLGIPLTAAGQVTDGLYLERARFGEGHAAPPRHYLKTLLSNLLSDPRDWSEVFRGGLLPGLIPSRPDHP
jgi:hypothetical protein